MNIVNNSVVVNTTFTVNDAPHIQHSGKSRLSIVLETNDNDWTSTKPKN
jgi:hypothetical protein